MKELVAIEITDEQAIAFRLFMEHYKDIQLMQEAGIWDIKQGSATMNFDVKGMIRSIKKETISYPQQVLA